jgi:hypothetical protein
MTEAGTLLANRTGIVLGLGAAAFWLIAGIDADLVRRSKFSPESRMPAYLSITDIEKSSFAGNPFLTSRP